MQNKIKLVLMGLMALIGIFGVGYKTYRERQVKLTDVSVVLSLEDTVNDNTIWCGTFNLIWNDLKDIAGQDIEFSPQLDVVKHLNQGTFTTKELNESSYYKIVDIPSLVLKEKITKEIKEKFNETSDILDDFDWENHDAKDYFLYAMLKKEFDFQNEFTELKKDRFQDTKNIAYFGIDATTKESVRQQVEVLYYKDNHQFAVKLQTQNEDEIILTRGRRESSFKEIYNALISESKEYKGSHNFGDSDTLKVPNLNFKVKKEFTELEKKDFKFANAENYYIDKALQTVQFELNKKGGKVKSEAGMSAKNFSLAEMDTPRNFDFDEPFTLFLKEKEKELPYLAIQVNDIEKFV